MNRLAKIVRTALRHLIGRQMDHQPQRPPARYLFRRTDDVVFGVWIKVPLVKGRRVKRIEQLRQSAGTHFDAGLCRRWIGGVVFGYHDWNSRPSYMSDQPNAGRSLRITASALTGIKDSDECRACPNPFNRRTRGSYRRPCPRHAGHRFAGMASCDLSRPQRGLRRPLVVSTRFVSAPIRTRCKNGRSRALFERHDAPLDLPRIGVLGTKRAQLLPNAGGLPCVIGRVSAFREFCILIHPPSRRENGATFGDCDAVA